jgi:adenylate kinase
MSGRRVCGCGASYHIEHKKPVKEGICDICGGELICRKDDAPETVKERLRIYHEQTEPLKGYYEKSGLLKIVDGQGDVDYITKVVFAALGL